MCQKAKLYHKDQFTHGTPVYVMADHYFWRMLACCMVMVVACMIETLLMAHRLVWQQVHGGGNPPPNPRFCSLHITTYLCSTLTIHTRTRFDQVRHTDTQTHRHTPPLESLLYPGSWYYLPITLISNPTPLPRAPYLVGTGTAP